jgi:hypothetical protein
MEGFSFFIVLPSPLLPEVANGTIVSGKIIAFQERVDYDRRNVPSNPIPTKTTS